MTEELTDLTIERDAELPTWFGVGGRADRLARPESHEELRRCLELDPDLRVLGDGANLLVDDDGVGDLVVSVQTEGFRRVEWDESSGRVLVGAGVALPRLINLCVARGLGGLEGLAGIPATVGGATVMNAGGSFGEFGSSVARVEAMDRAGRVHDIPRDRIDFGYRRSRLNHLIVTGVELQLVPGDVEDLRAEQLRCMAHKKQTQPLADKSAGCVFRNPTLGEAIEGVGRAGQRVSAGLLLDRAGCKGLGVGGASVSERHANFVVTSVDARARDVIELIGLAAQRVFDRFGVELEREVVVWQRAT